MKKKPDMNIVNQPALLLTFSFAYVSSALMRYTQTFYMYLIKIMSFINILYQTNENKEKHHKM